MHELVAFIVAVSLVTLVSAGVMATSLLLWVRTRRRRARRRLEQTLDRLAEQVAHRLASGKSPGWALARYARLAEDAGSARTWGSLQRLVLRERLLDEARAVLLAAPDRWDALKRSRRTAIRADSAER